MIKTAILLITLSGYGVVYENPYTTMELCLADKTAVAEQINDRYGEPSIQVLCVPNADNSRKFFRLFDRFIDRIPEPKCGSSETYEQWKDDGVWKSNPNTTKGHFCNLE